MDSIACTDRILRALAYAYADTTLFNLDALIRQLDDCYSALDALLNSIGSDDDVLEDAKLHIAAFEQFARMLRNTIEKAEKGKP